MKTQVPVAEELDADASGHPPEPRCEVRVVRTDAELDALEPSWDLLLGDAEASVFQTFEWLRTWWSYFAGHRKLHCLVFTRDDRVVGIAPLFLEDVRILGIRIVTRLRFLGCGISDYMDVIVARGCEDAVLDAFARHLRQHAARWDIVELADVNERSPVFERFPWLLREQGMDTYSYQGSVCPYTRLPDTWHEFRQQLSQKTRYHLTRKRAKLDERHQWKVELFQSPSDDIDLAVREFIAVHEQRWKSLGFRSAFDDPRHRAFHFEVSRKLARRGWLRLFFLTIDGRRVAVTFDFNFGRRIHVYLSHAHGPDEVMKLSPGLLIRAVAIERGIAEGMQIYDLLRGTEAYKYEELRCTSSLNWLIRAVDRSRTARIRFRVFLVREVLAKTLDRLRREYYDLKRFVLTEKPSAMTMLRSVRARCAVLRTVGRTYVRRFSSPARASAPDDSSGRPEIGTWSPR